MSEAVLYRKYRPQKFSEVLGQEHVVKSLKGAIEQENIGHAYLFSGSRGTGKTSMARIFAKRIGTLERDLHEIDAASNRGIDDVRQLREEVYNLPFESPYKVYVIDEVHMLTKEAFNALLKTLEEPPSHVVFILATTEYDKLPETIISRCQSFTFKKPSIDTLKKMISKIAKKEGYTVSASSSELLALLAEGSYRDAHGYLQQAIASSSDKEISTEEIEAVTGAPKHTQIKKLIDAIGEGDIDTAIQTLTELSESGASMNTLMLLLLRFIRAILLIRSAPSMRKSIQEDFSEEEFDAIEKHAGVSKKNINSKLLSKLLDAYMQLGSTHTPELPLELALLEYFEKDD